MRKVKLFPIIITGAFFFAIAVAGCNNGDDKETKKDSTVVKTDTMVTMKDTSKMMKDTMHMDSLKVPVKKPINNP